MSSNSLEAYTVLPLRLPNPPSLPATFEPAIHYLYLRPHASELRHWVPDLPEDDVSRSLYASNVPFDATETSLRRLFSEHLGGSRVERVEFCSEDIIHGEYAAKSSRHKRGKPEHNAVGTNVDSAGPRGRKRKRRIGQEELEVPEAQLPGVEDEELLLRSGACAVLVFVDKASASLALKACQKIASDVRNKRKGRGDIEWDSGRAFGKEYYKQRYQRQFPAREDLLRSANEYLTRYDALEDARKRAQARARNVPDEDGFVTVTRGGRAGPARVEDAKEALRKQQEREKKNSTDNFYRFQFREKAKEKERELKRKFEQDVQAVQKMRDNRKGRKWAL